MGLGKWIIKNGPGSPGSTAKAYAKQYNNIASGNHDENWEGIFSALFSMRISASTNMGGNLLPTVDSDDIIEYTEGDLTLFVFVMMYLETSNFRNNITAHRDTFLLSTEVLHETIQENTRNASKLSLTSFREKAIGFVSNFN